MSATWAAFAHTGKPEHSAIPQWPVYEPTSRATMILDTEWRVENDPRGETRKLWQEITAR
jgi:para-nitrobenzyl esterase